MTSLVFRAAAWLLVVAVAIFTLSPIQFRPVTGAPADIERFIAFAVISGMFCLGYPRQRSLVLIVVVGLAALLESLQHLIPDRHGEMHDFIVKGFGAIASTLIGSLVGQYTSARTTHPRDGRRPAHFEGQGGLSDRAARLDRAHDPLAQVLGQGGRHGTPRG